MTKKLFRRIIGGLVGFILGVLGGGFLGLVIGGLFWAVWIFMRIPALKDMNWRPMLGL